MTATTETIHLECHPWPDGHGLGQGIEVENLDAPALGLSLLGRDSPVQATPFRAPVVDARRPVVSPEDSAP